MYCVFEFHFRLSIQIGANEEHLGPDPSKFREGHTKVSDVERIYLTGKYKEKYMFVHCRAPFSAIGRHAID